MDWSSSSIQFTDLPDAILFRILKHLSTPDLVRLCSLCCRLYTLGRHELLWCDVDVGVLQLKPKKMWALFRQMKQSAKQVESLRIRGFVDSATLRPAVMSKSLALELLAFTSLHRLRLHSIEFDFPSLDVLQPLENVEYLNLSRCLFPTGFLDVLDVLSVFPKLCSLDVSHSPCVQRLERPLASRTALKELRVENCIKLSKTSLLQLCTSLINLEVLVISNNRSAVDDVVVHTIGRNLSKLRHLDVSCNNCISNMGFGSLCYTGSLPQLRHLDISCTILSDRALEHLSGCGSAQSLRCVRLVRSSCSQEAVAKIRELMPECEFVYD